MVAKPIDVTCIGNAIVDVFSQVTDDFLIENGIERATDLIDAERAALLYGKMDPGMEMSGGSAETRRLVLRRLVARRVISA